MDITETFRTEDISKTDFFDFVVAPDINQSFTKQMRAVNVFLEDDSVDQKETNNNTLIIDPAQDQQHTLNSATLDISTNSSSNNTITSSYDPLFWNCDKETVRLETAILEDLNKYCWSQDTTDTIVSNNISISNSGNSCDTVNNNNTKLLNNNTDGHIYTLTVLNGVEQTHWYRPPTSLHQHAIVKDDEGGGGSLSSPSPMEHIPQPQLDIDSILNIIPNGFNNNYEHQTLSPQTTDGLIKSETFTYDDSGYADTKDEIANALIIDTPMLEAHDNFNNNNNDWKIDNNNTTNNNNNNNSAESLLRSALQGKTFLRYQKKTMPESHSELRRALSTPPTKNDVIPLENDHQMMTVQLGNNNIILFDNANQLNQHQRGDAIPEHNPSSTQSMDDLLLSQLDTNSYPVEDYEKLKRIANEVAESVQQYCQLDGVTVVDANNIYVSGDLSNTGDGMTTPVTTGPTIIQSTSINPSSASTTPTVVVTSSKSTPKKYKRTNSNNSSKQNTNNTTNVQTATSTSNGVRKERSLHYCSICSKGFKDKYSVNVHIRTHTGEKPFACSLCGKSFRQKAHLAKHYQTHIAQKNAAANAAANSNSTNKKSTPTINNNSTVVVQSVTTPTSTNAVSITSSITPQATDTPTTSSR